MKYAIDNISGNKLSILGYGCMRFPKSGSQIDMSRTEALLLRAIEEGINYFDTAYLYPGSEAALGAILAGNRVRDKVLIATKLPIMMCRRYRDFDKYLDTQLERLQTDHIDYYLMHAITGPAQWQQLCELGIEAWIQEKKQEGKIRQIGFSFHGRGEDFHELLDRYDWEFCQIQYNYANVNYQAGEAGLKRAAAKGLPVFIMEPLLGGQLAVKLPPKAAALLNQANPAISSAAWSFQWLWNQPEVTVVLSGMSDAEQLEDNLKSAERSGPDTMKPAEHETISQALEIFTETFRIPCTGCNYCMPCPRGINIPLCFSAYNASCVSRKGSAMQQYVISTDVLSTSPHYASDCIGCGKCEQHCPQNIPIRDALKEVSRTLEPFWFKPALAIYKRIYGR